MNSVADNKENFCLLVRGLPGSGKTTLCDKLIKKLTSKRVVILDPDLVNIKSKQYKHFKPRMTKNPSVNVKKYAYLFYKAQYNLENDTNVLWAQPWSRISELDLTIRNFSFYFCNNANPWATSILDLINRLPFWLLIVEIEISKKVSLARFYKKHGEDLNVKRLIKTQKLFQKLNSDLPLLKLDGQKPVEENIAKVVNFINNYTNK